MSSLSPEAFADFYFERIVGHRFEIKQMAGWAKADKVPHALLFTGPASVGKKFSAFMFAATLLVYDADPENAHKLLLSGNHPDLYSLDLEEGKKDISVEAIRTLIEQLQLNSYYGRGRVAIVDQAEHMSISAANALLKTLEEPAAHTHLILISAFPHRLPPTIVSRCQQVVFGPLATTDKLNILNRLLGDEQFLMAHEKEIALLTIEGLALLKLDKCLNPATGQVKDSEILKQHLTNLCTGARETKVFLGKLLANAHPSNTPTALSFIAKITTDKDNLVDLDVFWYLLKLELASKLRTTGSTEIWARLLEQTITTEQLCQERNANTTLQISALLSEIMASF